MTPLNTITKFQSMEWKKQEWPGCADLAINYIHAQCQKFSQSGVPSPAQLTSLIEIIDEFIFRSIFHASSSQCSNDNGNDIAIQYYYNILQLLRAPRQVWQAAGGAA